MLRQNWLSVARITRFVDNLIVIAAFYLAYYGRNSLFFWDRNFELALPFSGEILAPISSYYILLIVGLPVLNLTWSAFGAYNRTKIFSSFRLFQIFASSSFVLFFSIAAALFLLKLDLSRTVIILFCVIVALSLTAERFFIRWFFRYWRGTSRNLRNILIVGRGVQGVKIQQEIQKRPEMGINIVGFVYPTLNESAQKDKDSVGHHKIFYGIKDLEQALQRYAIDEVIFTDVRSDLEQVENMIIICSEQGVRVTLAADLFSIGMVKSEISYFAGTPLIHYHTPPGDSWELALKRGIDIVLSIIFMIILAPMFIVIALGIRIMSPGPVIFKQKRVGLNGRIFSMYKFRSMKVGAESELQSLIDKNEMDGPVFKLTDDPRITPFGRFLRRFSLDELPQLFNVFRGDMSIVGPRPPVPDEVHQYVRIYRRRLSMRPGLTCIWQVSGRNEIRDFDTWMKLDLEYIDNWSLLMDLKIMLRTIPAVLLGHGAR